MTAAQDSAQREWWRPVVMRPVQATAGVAPRASSRRSGIAFWALMYFMFSLLIAPQTFIPGLDLLHLAAVAVVLAIGAHVATSLRAGQPIFGGHPAMRWAAVLAVWALLTAPFSRWPGGTVELLFDLYFKSLVIFCLLGVIIDTRERLVRFTSWITLLSVPIGATAIMHFLNGVYVQGGDSSAPRIVGYDAPLTENPNDLALVLSMMLPIAGALAVAETRPLRRLVFAAIAGLDVIAVVITFSRGGFVTLAALALALLFKLPRQRALLWAAGIFGAALMLVPFLPGGYMEHMGTITAIQTDPTGSAQNRWSDIVTATMLVVAHPIIGAGAGMSVLALNEARGATWVPVHNVYLEYATDLGLPGLLFFLLMLGGCMRSTARALKEIPRNQEFRDLRCVAVGVQLMLIAFAVAGLFHPVAYHFHFYYAGGLAAALAVVWENERASITSDPGVRQRPRNWWDRTAVRESREWHRPVDVPRPRRGTLTLWRPDGRAR